MFGARSETIILLFTDCVQAINIVEVGEKSLCYTQIPHKINRRPGNCPKLLARVVVVVDLK